MATITTYKNFNIAIEDVSLSSIISNIKSGIYHDSINAIRMAKSMGESERADQLKKELLAFTPSATFKDGRKKNLLTAYSGCVHLDFDKLTPEVLQMALDLAVNIPFTYACFISPSGDGLKVFVKVNTDQESHEQAYKQVQAHYEKEIGIEADPKCKDITRLCFVSDDPNAFYNENAITFEISLQEQATLSEPLFEQAQISFNTIFDECVGFTNKIMIYNNGNRNNYLYQLACNCNRRGISHPEAEHLITSNFYHENQTEIRKSIESAYQNNLAEFGKFANLAGLPKKQTTKEITNDSTEDYLKTTPTIPVEAIILMPNLFQEGAKAFENDPRKRDVFLTSALCIMSGCLPSVQGVYHQERVYPHLFSFIIAPAASGKGVLKNAKRLGDKIHERMVENSKQAREQFENEMVDYKAQLSKRKKDDSIPEKPQEPAFKLLFIPADCSQAMMMQILQDNDGRGIICETEADAMSGANKQDWGNYSHIMRAAFHHEKISAARKTNRELLEIKHPQLAVALSGTPSQVPKLIASAEDGLFSRFIFYAFKNEIVWQDPSPRPGGIVYNDHFEALSNEVLKIVDFLNQYPTEVFLTQNQWDKLNQVFFDKLKNVVIFTGEDAASVVFRLGLILYRFCMIFTSLRKFENGDCSKDVTCTDEDFQAALMLSEVYLQHSLLMFNNLEEQKITKEYTMPNNKKQFLEQLPQEFQRKEAVAIGIKLGLSERSVDDFLNNSVPMLLEKPKTGHYRKVA
ncbi:MAG TPA: DUF3987 domain-containing protein [Chitinophagales bacterium]|nr:DUF3987 domain-containing protein [Chitinophagales bacterium]